MNCRNNNQNQCIYNRALRKIEDDNDCKPAFGAIGPTGPTARLVNSSNK